MNLIDKIKNSELIYIIYFHCEKPLLSVNIFNEQMLLYYNFSH